MPRRTLTLRTERLTELAGDDLRAVHGGEVSKLACPSEYVNTCTAPSRQFVSLCGCFTDYCSIDVC
ncbi:MAG TPA: hypothetical protein VNA20_01245 [Frankiaceae bacterium]|nr:hypothetical protein [Frankiaceae bacterium]